MIFAAALASSQPGVPTPGFDEALTRAKRYEKQFDDFRMGRFYGVVGPALADFGKECLGRETFEVEKRFVMVVSYQDGRFDSVETDNADPAAACFREKLSTLSYPSPPVPDFAEQMNMNLEPRGAPEPGQGPASPEAKPDRH